MQLTRSESNSSFIDEKISGSTFYRPRAKLEERDDATHIFVPRLKAIIEKIISNATAPDAPKGIRKLKELVLGLRKGEEQEENFSDYSIHDQIGILIDFIKGRKIGEPLPWYSSVKWIANWTNVKRKPEIQEYYLQLMAELKILELQTGLYQEYCELLDKIPSEAEEQDIHARFSKDIFEKALADLGPDKTLSTIELQKVQKSIHRFFISKANTDKLIQKFEILTARAEANTRKSEALKNITEEAKEEMQKALIAQEECLRFLSSRSKDIFNFLIFRSNEQAESTIHEETHAFLNFINKVAYQEFILLSDFLTCLINVQDYILFPDVASTQKNPNFFSLNKEINNLCEAIYAHLQTTYTEHEQNPRRQITGSGNEENENEVNDSGSVIEKDDNEANNFEAFKADLTNIKGVFEPFQEAFQKYIRDCLKQHSSYPIEQLSNMKKYFNRYNDYINSARYVRLLEETALLPSSSSTRPLSLPLAHKKLIDRIVESTLIYHHALVDTKQSSPYAIKQMAKLFEGKTKVKILDEKGKTTDSKWSELSYKGKEHVLRTKAPTFFGRIQTPAFVESNNDFVKEHDTALINILDQAGFIQKF